jgi:hypothetical protein
MVATVRSRKIAKRLWDLMEGFDAFDPVMHSLERLVFSLSSEDVKKCSQYYCWEELVRQLRHYAKTCSAIADELERKLRGECA